MSVAIRPQATLADVRAVPTVDDLDRDALEIAPITVVIPTLDEVDRIAGAVSSLSWADQVIVVDGGSRDGTATLAAAAGATVIVVPGQTIGAQRNAGIQAARNTWILALDADE
ncbi:MAG TPA: glycosyltransferase, partial [Gemmatimonadaceae bacterium]|nr:glycosyltransferase [Gemmatimonadaceae bacterium]